MSVFLSVSFICLGIKIVHHGCGKCRIIFFLCWRGFEPVHLLCVALLVWTLPITISPLRIVLLRWSTELRTPLLSHGWLPWEQGFVPALVYICLGKEHVTCQQHTSLQEAPYGLGKVSSLRCGRSWAQLPTHGWGKSNGCSQVLMKAWGIQLSFERRVLVTWP